MPPVSHRETPNNTPRYFIFAVCYGAFRGVLLTVKNNGGSFSKQWRLFPKTMVIVFALNHLGLGMNSVAVHRRGRLNLPDNIPMVYL